MGGRLLRSHVAMRPRLQAEESLLTVTRLALGTGAISEREKHRARDIQSAWDRLAKGESAVVRAQDRGGYEAALAGMGIQVEYVDEGSGG